MASVIFSSLSLITRERFGRVVFIWFYFGVRALVGMGMRQLVFHRILRHPENRVTMVPEIQALYFVISVVYDSKYLIFWIPAFS